MPRLRLLPPTITATTREECAPILRHLMQRGGAVALDTETTGLDKMRDRVLFWSMATKTKRYVFTADMLHFFSPLFEREDITWVFANAKYDLHLLRNMGIHIKGFVEDIVIMDALVDDTRPHGLKQQSFFAYEVRWGDFKELFLDASYVGDALGLDKKGYREFKKLSGGDKLLYVYKQNPNVVIEYASCDAFFTYQLWDDLVKTLAGEELGTATGYPGFDTLLDYFRVIDAPLTKVLFNMERRGVAIDLDYLQSIDIPMREGIKGAENKLHQLAGRKFNPRSVDDVRDILFGSRGFNLKPIRHTKSSKGVSVSTDEKTLTIIQERYVGNQVSKFAKELLAYRSLQKLHGTYVKGIQKHLGPDGRLRTSLNLHVARSGRFSSSEPNLQNVPRPDPINDPFLLRTAFIASEGYKLVDKDYPQIEFRVAAVNAGDTRMIDAIQKGWDIHNANTANMFNLDYDEIAAAKGVKDKHALTERQKFLLRRRQESKTVGLGTLFGEGAAKMASQLDITKEAAQKLKDRFFKTYPGIAQNIEDLHIFGHMNEYTTTMLGRKRRLHRINAVGMNFIVAEEQRQAYNTHIQGSAAELLKLAMLQIDASKELEELGGKMLLTVHDELILEAPAEAAEEVDRLMTAYMSDPLHWGPIQDTYPVPITPDGEIGDNWAECH